MRRKGQEAADLSRRFTRRALFLGGAQMALIAGLGLRMRWMQIDQADEFRLLAEENRVNIRLLPPARGQIFDRNGVPVAVNEPSYRISIIREEAGDPELVLQRLAVLIGLSEEAVAEALKEMKARRGDTPVTVADRKSVV